MKAWTAWARDLLAKHPLALLAVAALTGILLAEQKPEAGGVFAVAGAAFVMLTWLRPHLLWACVAGCMVFGLGHVQRWQETFGHPLLKLMPEGEALAVEVRQT